MVRSARARTWLKWVAIVFAAYAALMALSIGIVTLGGCDGMVGMSPATPIRCAAIPSGLGEILMTVFFTGFALLILGRWLWLAIAFIPPIVMEYRYRKGQTHV